ncbi:helix-turn-helix domain-containing protein [Streptomyces polyrhachis]|uniref:Helix-turn-helix domain-containing protein n=1 Tax=Streptomyces polyrhachis TaxID=1282885 RepID=A0ABW2GJD6_9ACTN
MSDNELGLFLRNRREAVTPAEVGLPAGPRRRTPGLRRSELATLAGVSSEYLTRLEQGRDRHPSAAVLGALADILRLTPAERVHLHILTKGAGGGPCTSRGSVRTVRPTVRALLERLEPSPAVLVNGFGDLLAWTEGYERLARPLGLLDGEAPNVVRYVLADPRARDAYPDWERVADAQVVALKQGPLRHSPEGQALIHELTLTAGAEFTGRLERLAGLLPGRGVQRIVHPEAGELRLAYEMLDLPVDDAQRLVVHLPADPATAAALDRINSTGSGALRAVPA